MALGALTVTLRAEIWNFIKRFRLAKITLHSFAKIAKATVDLVSTTLGRLGVAALAAFGVMAAGIILFRKEMAPAIKLQEQMSSVATLLRTKAGEAYSYVDKWVRQFTDDVLRLSSAFGDSTESVAKGLYDILSATIPVTDAINVLTVAMRAARAGLATTAIATKAIVSVLMSYNMRFNQAAKVSDIFFATIRIGVTTFKELAPVIGRAAATAAAAGLSFEELMASIATMTRAGLDTGVAITSINQTLLQFFNPAEEAMLIADELGMTLDLTTLRTEGLLSVMEKMSEVLPEQVGKMFRQMRALRGVNALIQQITGFTSSYNVMLDAAGETQIAFAKRAQALQMTLDRVRESWKNLKKQAIMPFLPSMKKAGDALAGFLEILGKGGGDTARLVANLIAVSTALAGVVGMAIIATKIFAALGISLGALALVLAKIVAIGVAIGAVIAAFIWLEKRTKMFSSALEILFRVFSLGLAGVDDVVASMKWLGKAIVNVLKWLRILKSEAWADQAAVDALTGTLKSLTEGIDASVEPTDELQDRWKAVIDTLKRGAPMTIEVKNALQDLRATIKDTNVYSLETKEGLDQLVESILNVGSITDRTRKSLLNVADQLRDVEGSGSIFANTMAVVFENVAATGTVADVTRDKLLDMYRRMEEGTDMSRDLKDEVHALVRILLSVGDAAQDVREQMAAMTEEFVQERARIARLRAAFSMLGGTMPEEIETAQRRIGIAFRTIFKDGKYTTDQLTDIWLEQFIPKLMEAFEGIAPAFRKTTEDLLGYTWRVVEAAQRMDITLPTLEVEGIRQDYSDLISIIKDGAITAGEAAETMFSDEEMREKFTAFIERVRSYYGFIPAEYAELIEIMTGLSAQAMDDIQALGLEAPTILEEAAHAAYDAFMRLSEGSKTLARDFEKVMKVGEEWVIAPDVEQLKQAWAPVEERFIAAFGALPEFARKVYMEMIGDAEDMAEHMNDVEEDLVEQLKMGMTDYEWANYKMIQRMLPQWRVYFDSVMRMEDITKEARIEMLEDFLVKLKKAGAGWTDFAGQVQRALDALRKSYQRTVYQIIEDVATEWRREFSNMLEEDILNWEGHSQKAMSLVVQEHEQRKRELRDSLLEGKITNAKYYAELNELDRQYHEEKKKRVKGFAKLYEDIWASLKSFWIKLLSEMLAEYVKNKLKEVAIALVANKKKIAADAAEAGGAAVKSAAGIPFPLNLIAIGAAVAAVMALFNKMTSMAEGGIATKPMVAMIGEAGKEAVIPLGSPIGKRMLGDGGKQELYFNDTFILQGPTMVDDIETWDNIYKEKILPTKRRHMEELRDVSGEEIE